MRPEAAGSKPRLGAAHQRAPPRRSGELERLRLQCMGVRSAQMQAAGPRAELAREARLGARARRLRRLLVSKRVTRAGSDQLSARGRGGPARCARAASERRLAGLGAIEIARSCSRGEVGVRREAALRAKRAWFVGSHERASPIAMCVCVCGWAAGRSSYSPGLRQPAGKPIGAKVCLFQATPSGPIYRSLGIASHERDVTRRSRLSRPCVALATQRAESV